MFVLGLVVGSMLGMFLMALCAAGKIEDTLRNQ